MARTTAGLPAGSGIADFIILGVLVRTFPAAKVHEVLASCGRSSVRRRDLPAHVVVSYVIALGLYMNCSCREALRCLLEGLQWLRETATRLKTASKSGISQARTRLGSEPMRRIFLPPSLASTQLGPTTGAARLKPSMPLIGATCAKPACRAQA